ncbi:RAM signaling network component [Dissophora globulifera]|nr:RAM signaling network component [Dissophora globulifera]
MSQGVDGGASAAAAAAAGARGASSTAGSRRPSGNGNLMSLIRERQGAAGSTQILDLSYANLDSFPSEIEFLREVLEKLTMSHNSIKNLPLQLNMFTSLRYLNIRANSIRIFPDVLCQLSSLEILDMSRNKISRFPDSFGNLMNLRVLSISRNRIETIPAYVGEMSQLQFLKIEQNPLVFPPQDVVDFPGQDMEGWLSRLKTFLLSHKREELDVQAVRRQGDDTAIDESQEASQSVQQQRNAPRSHSHQGSREEDHYRFISHSRGVSGDSTSSYGSNASNDCDRYSEVYFQRLATHPPPLHPLPGERIRLVEAARGILFALSQIYRAVKQVVGCTADEKFRLSFTRLLQSANTAMAHLIQSLDRFDSSAQVQVPDQAICAEIMRCCESNVVAFRKLVHMVQSQIRSISILADARLVRNLVLMLHGALSEIRVAWESLLPLLHGSGEVNMEAIDSSHLLVKDQQQQQHSSAHQTALVAAANHTPHLQQGHPHLPSTLSAGQQSYPFQLSPTISATSSWLPIQIPQRSQNMSRTSNHSAQSTTNMQQEEEEDAQLLLTVEHAVEAARRVIQCLTETCITRDENLLASPQQRPIHRARSVSASPPRSIGSNESGSGNVNSKNASQTMSPLQLAADTSSSGTLSSSLATVSIGNASGQSGNGKLESGLIGSPLFSPASDTVPYSNGMCVALPIDQSSITDVTSGQGDDSNARYERRPVSHSKGSSKASFDPALPSIPQDEANEMNSQGPTTSTTPQYQPVMTARSASVSGLPSGPHYSHTTNPTPLIGASSLPSPGFMGGNSIHPHMAVGHQPPTTPGYPPSSSSTFPYSSGGIVPLPASQLWHEMKDCLLQMTEIVKRLDLDLTMLRTDDYLHSFHQQNHSYQQGQFQPHSQMHFQNHAPHPHQLQQHGPSPYLQQSVVQLASGSEDPNILRRRFGLGVSDFVKSVVVISTLVRQLSSSSSGISKSGSGSAMSSDAGIRTIGPPTSVGGLSTSPSASRTRSGSGVDMSGINIPAGVSQSLLSSAHATDLTPNSTAATPSLASMSASSSASGAAITASPEKAGQLQSQSSAATQQQSFSRQNSSQLPKYPLHSQTQQQQQHSSQQPEIFSRLVMTHVSNLTKITKELTVRMPRSSFRDYLLSSSAGGGMMGVASGGITATNGGGGSYGFGYGPAGASILAMRKGSLI